MQIKPNQEDHKSVNICGEVVYLYSNVFTFKRITHLYPFGWMWSEFDLREEVNRVEFNCQCLYSTNIDN